MKQFDRSLHHYFPLYFADVGFPVGKSKGINQLVMQIHYKDAIPGKCTTEFTKQRVKLQCRRFPATTVCNKTFLKSTEKWLQTEVI